VKTIQRASKRRSAGRRASKTCARARRNDGGFTIVEVILAMFILLVGMTSILGLLSFGASLTRTAHLRTNAAAAVESVMSDLEETFFPLVNGEAGEPKKIERREIHGVADVVYSATPVQNPDRPIEYRVDIEMTWTSSGVELEKNFSTILLREVPFGERLRRRFVEGEEDALSSPRENATDAAKPTGDAQPGDSAKAHDAAKPKDSARPK
jgi:Tfp pilus assembly protein PilE